VTLAATTAALIVAADALIIGAYVSLIKDYKLFQQAGSSFRGHQAVLILAGVCIVGGFFCALYAVYPKIGSRSPDPNVLFFGWIAEQRSAAGYVRAYLEKDAGTGHELYEALLYQVYEKSHSLKRIFRFIQLAIALTMLRTLIVGFVVLTSAAR